MPRRKKRKEVPKGKIITMFCVDVDEHDALKNAIQVDKLENALSELEKRSLHRGASKDMTLPTLVAAFILNGIVNEQGRIRPIIIVADGQQRQRYLFNVFIALSALLDQHDLISTPLSTIIRLPKYKYLLP